MLLLKTFPALSVRRMVAGCRFCLFTDPEFARIVLSERDAKQKGISIVSQKIPFGMTLRAQTLSETRGFMKALIDDGDDRIPGFNAFGTEMGEIMASV